MVNRGQREQPKPDDERWPEEKRRTSTTKTPNYDWDHHHLYLVANSFLLHYCSQYKSNILAGRRHENVQTEIYLEELFVTPPVSDVCTQTDLFVERPISPFYVPAKTGADVETQIYPGDVSGDHKVYNNYFKLLYLQLFDFDMEVQPILEVLVGKTVEQALIEVLEEEELAALREQQRRFLELRATEMSEALR